MRISIEMQQVGVPVDDDGYGDFAARSADSSHGDVAWMGQCSADSIS
jgi:hypothetical protein